MTQQFLDFEPPRRTRPSLTDKLESWFRAHPREWLDVVAMAGMVGTSGVRQRRLEVEKRGLTLERRQWHSEDGHTHLAYRYVPAGSAQDGRAA